MPVSSQTRLDLQVSAAALLTTLPTARLIDGREVFCSAAGATHGNYILDKEDNTSVVDGVNVIATDTGSGRWIFEGPPGGAAAANISVPTEAALTAYPVTGLKDGAIAFVGDPAAGAGQAQGSRWELITQSGASPALAAHVVIASAAAGRIWQRQINWVNQKWVQSTLWFLDGTAGNDQNSGTNNLAPLATGAELARRMAKQAIGGGAIVTVTLLANIADDLDFTGVSGTILVTAAPTIVASGTLNASTAINRAANTFQTVGTAAFDFTPHLNRKIVLTSGSLAEAYVDSIPGANQARTSPFTTQAGGPFSGAVAVVTPAGNETFNIVTPITFRRLITDLYTSSFSNLTVSLVNVAPTTQGNNLHCGFVLLNRVDFSAGAGTGLSGTAFAFVLGSQVGQVTTAEVGGGLFAAIHGIGHFIGGSQGGTTFQFSQDAMISDHTIFTNNCFCQLNAVGFRNTTASRNAVDCRPAPFPPNAKIVIATALYGSLAGATSIGFVTDKYTEIDSGGITPTMTTTGANVAFGSQNRTWAQLPFYDSGIQALKPTLANGTTGALAVPGNFTANAQIVATTRTVAGVGAPGVLSVPDATRNVGAKTIVVNSAVAGDNSTLDVVITDGPIIGNAQPTLPYNFASWV